MTSVRPDKHTVHCGAGEENSVPERVRSYRFLYGHIFTQAFVFMHGYACIYMCLIFTQLRVTHRYSGCFTRQIRSSVLHVSLREIALFCRLVASDCLYSLCSSSLFFHLPLFRFYSVKARGVRFRVILLSGVPAPPSMTHAMYIQSAWRIYMYIYITYEEYVYMYICIYVRMSDCLVCYRFWEGYRAFSLWIAGDDVRFYVSGLLLQQQATSC